MPVNLITSKDNPKIKEVIKLKKPSYQKERGLFIVESIHLLEMANEAGVLDSVFTLKEIEGLPSSINQYIVTPDIMKKMSLLETSPGVLALVRFIKKSGLSSHKLLYLDNIQDPGNVGTILRTALAFGFTDILISPNTCSVYNPKVIQASQGSIFKLNILTYDYDELLKLKDSGYQIIATSLKTSISLEEIKKPDRYVVIFGNEARGVNETLLSSSDINVRIDINSIDSLNVAIAAGIIMYKLQ